MACAVAPVSSCRLTAAAVPPTAPAPAQMARHPLASSQKNTQSIEILPPHASRLPTVTSMNTIVADHALVQTLEQLAATRGIDDPATLAAIYAATSR